MTEQAQRAYEAWVSEQTYPQCAPPANLLDQQQQRAWEAVAKVLRCDDDAARDAVGLRESNELLKAYIEELREALIQMVGLLPAGTIDFCCAVNNARKVLQKGQK